MFELDFAASRTFGKSLGEVIRMFVTFDIATSPLDTENYQIDR
jgi:hypothetical protein